jgi:hypothetical protein
MMKKYFPIKWGYLIDRLFYLLLVPALESALFVGISLFVCMVIMQYNAILFIDTGKPVVFIDAGEPFVFCFAILFVGKVFLEMLEFPFTQKAKKIDRLHFILRNMSSENELVLLDLIDKNKEVFE